MIPRSHGRPQSILNVVTHTRHTHDPASAHEVRCIRGPRVVDSMPTLCPRIITMLAQNERYPGKRNTPSHLPVPVPHHLRRPHILTRPRPRFGDHEIAWATLDFPTTSPRPKSLSSLSQCSHRLKVWRFYYTNACPRLITQYQRSGSEEKDLLDLTRSPLSPWPGKGIRT